MTQEICLLQGLHKYKTCLKFKWTPWSPWPCPLSLSIYPFIERYSTIYWQFGHFLFSSFGNATIYSVNNSACLLQHPLHISSEFGGKCKDQKAKWKPGRDSSDKRMQKLHLQPIKNKFYFSHRYRKTINIQSMQLYVQFILKIADRILILYNQKNNQHAYKKITEHTRNGIWNS